MRKFFTWLFLMTKKQLKSPLMIIMLVLIPIIAFVANITKTDGNKTIRYKVGIYCEGEDSLSSQLSSSLISYDGPYRFIKYNSEAQLTRDIKNDSIVAGFVLPDNLSDITSKEVMSNCIKNIRKPNLTLIAALNETVYCELIKIQGLHIITDYVKNAGLFNGTNVDFEEELKGYYQKYLASTETFQIDYEIYGDSKSILDISDNPTVSFPVRGILAILIFLAAMFGGIMWLRDSEKEIFATVTESYKKLTMVFYTVIPTFAFAIASLFAIKLVGIYETTPRELGAMLLYVIIAPVFSILMIKITGKSKNYSSLLPVILLCCLVFCPIFINTSQIIPAAKYIEKLFIPYYYLRFFS